MQQPDNNSAAGAFGHPDDPIEVVAKDFRHSFQIEHYLPEEAVKPLLIVSGIQDSDPMHTRMFVVSRIASHIIQFVGLVQLLMYFAKFPTCCGKQSRLIKGGLVFLPLCMVAMACDSYFLYNYRDDHSWHWVVTAALQTFLAIPTLISMLQFQVFVSSMALIIAGLGMCLVSYFYSLYKGRLGCGLNYCCTRYQCCANPYKLSSWGLRRRALISIYIPFLLLGLMTIESLFFLSIDYEFETNGYSSKMTGYCFYGGEWQVTTAPQYCCGTDGTDDPTVTETSSDTISYCGINCCGYFIDGINALPAPGTIPGYVVIAETNNFQCDGTLSLIAAYQLQTCFDQSIYSYSGGSQVVITQYEDAACTIVVPGGIVYYDIGCIASLGCTMNVVSSFEDLPAGYYTNEYNNSLCSGQPASVTINPPNGCIDGISIRSYSCNASAQTYTVNVYPSGDSSCSGSPATVSTNEYFSDCSDDLVQSCRPSTSSEMQH